MRMRVEIINEAGMDEALMGLSMNKNQPVDKMMAVADKLAPLDGGHNKFLESIVVWLDITAPRYWWQEFDTYRIGVTKQSQSTMHTIMRRELDQDDFNEDIPEVILNELNLYIREGGFRGVKRLLPEAFLQRRIVCLNYKAIRHILAQRYNHKLEEWSTIFVQAMYKLARPSWVFERKKHG